MNKLNRPYTSLSAHRRYEVWFVRLGLEDSAGAWWFRYLLLNPGRNGCPGNPQGMHVQIWATWIPAGNKQQSFIQGSPLGSLVRSERQCSSSQLRTGNNE